MLWSDSSNGAPSPSHETTPPKAGMTKSKDSLGTWQLRNKGNSVKSP